MRKLHSLAAGVAVLAALMVGIGSAQATGHLDRQAPATTLTKVTVRPDGATHRVVRVTTSGPPLTYLAVCDLTTSTCVNAHRASSAWAARLPARDPDGPYAIGVVARSPGGFVTGHFASDPPPDIPPIPRIG
jgi:hypothetical protein